jgi:hypothetical protein
LAKVGRVSGGAGRRRVTETAAGVEIVGYESLEYWDTRGGTL